MGGGSSGGGGTTTSETKAEFAPEFRPLATAAVNEILGLQQVNPLANFAAAHPQTTVPLGQLQQTGINFAPQLFNRMQGQDELRGLFAPFNRSLSNISAAGGPTQGAQSSLDALAASGRVGQSQLSPAFQAPQLSALNFGGSLIPGGFTLAPAPPPIQPGPGNT